MVQGVQKSPYHPMAKKNGLHIHFISCGVISIDQLSAQNVDEEDDHQFRPALNNSPITPVSCEKNQNEE